jgi:hypothetical protein
MAVSPNGAFVALACNDGRLRVMTSGEQVCGMHAWGLHNNPVIYCSIALTGTTTPAKNELATTHTARGGGQFER